MINIGEETEQIEFKKSTGELKEGIISIASILNKHGSGTLYFGVKNNGDVIGQEISDQTIRNVSQAIQNHIVPAIYPVIDKKTYEDGKSVIFVEFQGSRQPYTAYNVPRIREADEDIVMNQEQYFEMMLIRDDGKHAWENQPSKYTVADINMNDLRTYLNNAKKAGRITFESDNPEVVMNKLELFAADGIHLLNAGAALFCDINDTDVQMGRQI